MRRLGLGGGGRQCPRPRAACRRKKLWLSFCIMHSALWWNLAAAVPTRADDYYQNSPPEAQGLLSGLFQEKPKGPSKGQARGQAKGQAKNDKNAIAVRPQPMATVTAMAAEQLRHKNAWLRRMEVCDRLKTIADQTGNEALLNQAYELEERANLLYRQQTYGLPAPVQTPLAVLADDPQTMRRGGMGPAASAPLPQPNGRGPGGILMPSGSSAPRLEGNMDQREQAILNGTSMGGNGR